MFSLRFSGSKFLINLRRQLVYVKFFRVHNIFRTQVLAGFVRSFYFVFKITIPKECNLCSRLAFH